jgi:hypothetical protein
MHIQRFRQQREIAAERSLIAFRLLKRKLNPHKEEAELIVLVLIGMQDIGILREQKIGNRSD